MSQVSSSKVSMSTRTTSQSIGSKKPRYPDSFPLDITPPEDLFFLIHFKGDRSHAVVEWNDALFWPKKWSDSYVLDLESGSHVPIKFREGIFEGKVITRGPEDLVRKKEAVYFKSTRDLGLNQSVDVEQLNLTSQMENGSDDAADSSDSDPENMICSQRKSKHFERALLESENDDDDLPHPNMTSSAKKAKLEPPKFMRRKKQSSSEAADPEVSVSRKSEKLQKPEGFQEQTFNVLCKILQQLESSNRRNKDILTYLKKNLKRGTERSPMALNSSRDIASGSADNLESSSGIQSFDDPSLSISKRGTLSYKPLGPDSTNLLALPAPTPNVFARNCVRVLYSDASELSRTIFSPQKCHGKSKLKKRVPASPNRKGFLKRALQLMYDRDGDGKEVWLDVRETCNKLGNDCLRRSFSENQQEIAVEGAGSQNENAEPEGVSSECLLANISRDERNVGNGEESGAECNPDFSDCESDIEKTIPLQKSRRVQKY